MKVVIFPQWGWISLNKQTTSFFYPSVAQCGFHNREMDWNWSAGKLHQHITYHMLQSRRCSTRGKERKTLQWHMNQSPLTIQPGNQLSMKAGYLAARSLLAAATATCLVHTRRPRCWQLLCCDAHYQYQGHQATGHWGTGPSREWRPACILFNRSLQVTYIMATSWLISPVYHFISPISDVYLTFGCLFLPFIQWFQS